MPYYKVVLVYQVKREVIVRCQDETKAFDKAVYECGTDPNNQDYVSGSFEKISVEPNTGVTNE